MSETEIPILPITDVTKVLTDDDCPNVSILIPLCLDSYPLLLTQKVQALDPL